MRKFSLILAALLIAGTVYARPQATRKTITLGTNSSGSATMALAGYIDTVYVAVSDGASTGTVTLAYAPSIGGTSINVATNAVTDEKVWRPVVDRTDTAGAALTSDEPQPFIMNGETLTFSVSSSPTGLLWRIVVISEDGK